MATMMMITMTIMTMIMTMMTILMSKQFRQVGAVKSQMLNDIWLMPRFCTSHCHQSHHHHHCNPPPSQKSGSVFLIYGQLDFFQQAAIYLQGFLSINAVVFIHWSYDYHKNNDDHNCLNDDDDDDDDDKGKKLVAFGRACLHLSSCQPI